MGIGTTLFRPRWVRQAIDLRPFRWPEGVLSATWIPTPSGCTSRSRDFLSNAHNRTNHSLLSTGNCLRWVICLTVSIIPSIGNVVPWQNVIKTFYSVLCQPTWRWQPCVGSVESENNLPPSASTVTIKLRNLYYIFMGICLSCRLWPYESRISNRFRFTLTGISPSPVTELGHLSMGRCIGTCPEWEGFNAFNAFDQAFGSGTTNATSEHRGHVQLIKCNNMSPYNQFATVHVLFAKSNRNGFPGN